MEDQDDAEEKAKKDAQAKKSKDSHSQPTSSGQTT